MTAIGLSTVKLQAARRIQAACRSPSPGNMLLQELERLNLDAERQMQRQDSADPSLIGCGPGCGHCCVVNVSVLLPEAFLISRYIMSRPQPERVDLSQRLERLWTEIRGLDDEERLVARRCCAFLDKNGCCRIYPLRPILCRSINSTDPQSCRDAVTGQVFGQATPVLMNQVLVQGYQDLFTEVAEGLEAGGLDGRSFPLSGLVRHLLRKPQQEAALLDGHRLSWDELY